MRRALIALLLSLTIFVLGCAQNTPRLSSTHSITPSNQIGLFHDYKLGDCIYAEPDNCDDI